MNERLTRKGSLDGVQYREIGIRQDAIDDDARTVALSFSSDAPILRRDWMGEYREILSHEPGAVRLGRIQNGAAVLMDHNARDQVGAVNDARIEGGKGRALIRFSKSARASEIFQDVQDGIRSKISVGYRIYAIEESEGVNGEPETVRVTDWEPVEISIVSIAADDSVGVGRNETMNDTVNTEPQHATRSERKRENRRKEAEREIFAIGDAYGERELAERIALEGGTEQDLKSAILAKRNNVSPLQFRDTSGLLPWQDGRHLPAEFGRRHSNTRRELIRAFGDDTHEAQENAYRAGMWIVGNMFGNEQARRWCESHGIRAMAGGIMSKGGATVPHELSRAIIDLQELYGVARQETEIMPMGSDTLTVPRHTGGVTAYFVGENSEITDSDAEWDDVNLVARKLAALTRVSTELIEDSVVDIAAFLANEIGKRFAEKEDDCLWNGDGTSTYGGIQGVCHKLTTGDYVGAMDATAGDDQFTEIIASDLDALMGLVPKYALPNAKWYCSQVANQLVFQALARASGGVTMVEHGSTIVRSYAGYPIVVSQKLPTATTALDGSVMLLFGDLRQATMMGTRREISVQILTERYADYDQIGVKATERFDIVTHSLGDDAEAGPIVGLVGNTS